MNTNPIELPAAPTGYGKQLRHLTAAEMAWWHKHSFHPVKGGVYLCRRGNKEHGTTSGKTYVFDGDQLYHFTARNQTLLLNGYNTLRQPYAFARFDKCPICSAGVFDPTDNSRVIHDCLECAQNETRAKERGC